MPRKKHLKSSSETSELSSCFFVAPAWSHFQRPPTFPFPWTFLLRRDRNTNKVDFERSALEVTSRCDWLEMDIFYFHTNKVSNIKSCDFGISCAASICGVFTESMLCQGRLGWTVVTYNFWACWSLFRRTLIWEKNKNKWLTKYIYIYIYSKHQFSIFPPRWLTCLLFFSVRSNFSDSSW